MRAARLLNILLTLQARGRASAADLAREQEVSVRTIYRDMDALSAAGAPVYGDHGPGGGFSLLDGWRTRLTGMTEAEAAAVPLASLAHAAADLGMADQAAAARLKLIAALSAGAGAEAQTVADRLHIDPVRWLAERDPAPLLRPVADLVWRGRRAVIDYEAWSGAVRREVDPLGLVLKAGVWYLVAGVEGSPRTFRVSAILDCVGLDEPVRAPRGFDLASHWGGAVRDFSARVLSGRALVRITEQGLARLKDVAPTARAAAEASARPGDRPGWRLARLPYEPGDFGRGVLLQLGGEVEVLRPRSLRAELAAEGARLAELYGVSDR